MPCPFVKVSCTSCGRSIYYRCTATYPPKKLVGVKRLRGTACKQKEPDCPIYDGAVKVVDEWNLEMEAEK